MLKLMSGILGITSVVVAVALLFTGGGIYWAEATLADAEGFIQSAPIAAEVDGYALVAGSAEIDLGPAIPFDLGELASLRIVAESRSEDPSRGVFIGVADSADVDGYLGGTPHAIVLDLNAETMSLSYRTLDGDLGGPPLPPADQPFWTASAYGVGEQRLVWEIESGDYSFVLMNDDAADGVSADLVVGARIPILRPVAVGLMIGGGVALTIGTLLLALAL